MKIINPATEEIIKELQEDSEAVIIHKLCILKEGQKEWHQISLRERIKIITRFSNLLQENIETCAGILTSEVGKPLQQARNEINGGCRRISWLCAHAEKYLADEYMTRDDAITEKIVYEPLGIICNISAWNYPYLVGINVFIPALLAGNAVLYKPSENASLTGLEIEKNLKRAGLPDSIFQVALGGQEVGKILLELPFDGYFFTGSYKTGKYIYEKVASKMVPCQLELGGKDPLYVADDVPDLQAVAAATADGAFYNNGQSCCAAERIYVHEKVYDQYVDHFLKEVKGFKVGDPEEDGVYFGPISRKQQLEVLEAQVKDAVEKGGKILTGGKSPDTKGYYFEPTIVVDVNQQMDLMREESFGPVIGIMKVKDDEEAVKMMQDTEYGLTASVYSNSQERAEKILSLINSGTGYWNCCDRVSAAVPWSGRKHSGFGATLSHIGIRAFTKTKSYHLKKV